MTMFINPRPEAVELKLSDGSVHLVPGWKRLELPDQAADGEPLRVVSAVVVKREPDDAA